MKYVVAHADKDTEKLEIDLVTNRPEDYLSSFEPIDIVGGRVLAWDEKGNEYSIEGGGISKQDKDKSFGVVFVGSWNFKEGEPKLVKIADNQEEKLKTLLVDFLTKVRIEKKSIFRRHKVVSPPLSKSECLRMSVKELMSESERYLLEKS